MEVVRTKKLFDLMTRKLRDYNDVSIVIPNYNNKLQFDYVENIFEEMIGIALSFGSNSFYLPFRHKTYEKQLDENLIYVLLECLFYKNIIGFNLKNDFHYLLNESEGCIKLLRYLDFNDILSIISIYDNRIGENDEKRDLFSLSAAYGLNYGGEINELKKRLHKGCSRNEIEDYGRLYADLANLVNELYDVISINISMDRDKETDKLLKEENKYIWLLAYQERVGIKVDKDRMSELKNDKIGLNDSFVIMDKIYPKYHCIGITGRQNSYHPNIQCLKYDMRDIVIPREGKILVSMDYKNIDMVFAAILSNDENLKKEIKTGTIYEKCAELLLGDEIDFLVKEVRDEVKLFVLGVNNGMGRTALNKRIDKMYNLYYGKSLKSYNESLRRFWKYFSKWNNYLNDCLETVSEKGEIRNVYGRRFIFPDLKGQDVSLMSYKDKNKIRNYPVQSSTSDFMKKAMNRICNNGMFNLYQIGILFQNHDEILFEIPKNHLEIIPSLVSLMKGDEFPVEVTVKISKASWKELNRITIDKQS